MTQEELAQPGDEVALKSRGLRLAALRGGAPDGPPVLALHGWLDNAASFAPLCAALGRWQWVAVDLPGHGQSQHRAADSDYPYLDWVADALGVLDALGWREATVVGHSMGAGIAALLAAVAPTRVVRLVLLDGIGPMSGDEAGLPARMARHLHEVARLAARPSRAYPSRAAMAACLTRLVPDLSPASARLLVARGSHACANGFAWSVDPRLRAQSARAFTEAHVLACLRAIVCPTLLVRPDAGYPADAAVLAARMAAIPNLVVHRLAGGHHVHMENAAGVAAALDSFVTEAARPAA